MRKHWPWLVLTLAVLAGAGLVLAHGWSATRTTAAVAATPGIKIGTMGTPVTRDGVLEYTVTSLDCGGVKVPGAVPKGRFCVVGITVRNLTEVAREPGISFARAYDAQGTGYLSDAVAQIRADPSGSSLLDDLAPGAGLSDRLFYDVPKARTITSVVLRESPPSDGIRIPLS
jgi:uncharacterized protein DUF4352